jgi:hypothetical protein
VRLSLERSLKKISFAPGNISVDGNHRNYLGILESPESGKPTYLYLSMYRTMHNKKALLIGNLADDRRPGRIFTIEAFKDGFHQELFRWVRRHRRSSNQLHRRPIAIEISSTCQTRRPRSPLRDQGASERAASVTRFPSLRRQQIHQS